MSARRRAALRRPLRTVVTSKVVEETVAARGGFLKEWELVLDCGHTVYRPAGTAQGQPARRCRCEECPERPR